MPEAASRKPDMVTKQQEHVVGRHKTANGVICVQRQQNMFKQESVRGRHLHKKAKESMGNM
eukprot:6477624-Ditylum_brightwellii.AAC.1